MPHKQLGGGVFLSHWGVFSLTERTEFTEVFNAHFEHTEGLRHTENTEASPPAPLRMERGVVCEVTPIGLLAHIIEFFLSQNSQSSRRFLAHISSTQDSGPSPNPSPAGRGVVCEVTPTRQPVR